MLNCSEPEIGVNINEDKTQATTADIDLGGLFP